MSSNESTARNPGDVCEATMTGIMLGTTELVPVRFVDGDNNDVALSSGKVAAFVFGPNAEGKTFRQALESMERSQ